jgi:ubiquinone biosynthesis protein
VTSHAERYRQITQTLTRHGLGFLVGAAGLQRWFPFEHGLLGHQHRTAPYSNAEHLRLALEELGPAFIKLGQILSTRSDLLPPHYLIELAKLQDAAPPVAGGSISDTAAQELGRSVAEAFASFDLTPLASASIGQAHAATLFDGTDVVVKVRRPGVVEQIEQDLEILQNLAARAARHWRAAADYDLPGLTQEFATTLRAELDYLAEGRNAERIAANFRDHPEVHIPRVFWNTTTARVLTLERIRGIKVDDLAGLDHVGIDRRTLATSVAAIAAKMIFDDGFFHADPHPGNLFIEPGGRIGLIDFGMVGAIDEPLRHRLGGLLVALVGQQPDRIAGALRAMTTTRGTVDRAQLDSDIVPIVALYENRSLDEVPIGALIRQVLTVLRRHRLHLPPEMALLMKMVVMTEGMGVALDPKFQLGPILAPYAQRLAAQRFSPRRVGRRLAHSGIDLADLLIDLPEQLRQMLEINQGGSGAHQRATELEPIAERMEQVGQRLVLALIAAALIKGAADLISSDGTRWQTLRAPIAGAGMGIASACGMYLTWTARRGRRPQ